MLLGSVVVFKLGESALQQSQLSLEVVSVPLILSQLEAEENIYTGNIRSVISSSMKIILVLGGHVCPT